jgi:hypothetical protein
VTTRRKKAKAEFAFSATEQDATFECRLDREGFTTCSSPLKFKVKPGKHSLAVRALNGNELDTTPAEFSWKVRRKR